MPNNPKNLLTQLNNTGLQNKDSGLYQFLKQLLDRSGASGSGSGSGSSGGGGTTIINNITNESHITQIVDGDGESGEDNYYLIGSQNATPTPFVEWSVLTNGDPVNPELIFVGGDVIMVHIP